ncbi:hypothetical protein BGZ65_004926 [Modicella reniformis]|uniref:Uncharacterized protein n=1 Tax=Modicella reniformis TaxID=1440133 RepID=A0A9P6SM19_9FUNG|nr:hypothetical protein BGZ65_004926 [Modicella reniformis]
MDPSENLLQYESVEILSREAPLTKDTLPPAVDIVKANAFGDVAFPSHTELPDPTTPIAETADAEISSPSTSSTSSTPEESSPRPSAATITATSSSSFYNNLEFDLDIPSTPSPSALSLLPSPSSPQLSSRTIARPVATATTAVAATATIITATRPSVLNTAIKTSSLTSPTTPSSAVTDIMSPSSDTNETPSSTARFGTKKPRVRAGNISQRVNMLESGKNQNNSDLHTVDFNKSQDTFGLDSPDASAFPESFWEELLKEDQPVTVARAATIAAKPTTIRPIVTHKQSMPLRLPSTIKSSGIFGPTINTTLNVVKSPIKHGDDDDCEPDSPLYICSGDPQEDLKQFESRLVRAKELKVKAHLDARDLRASIVALKSELEIVRNVLNRKESEVGDAADIALIYDGQLKELRDKLQQSERKLSRGQGEMEAKIRSLEFLRTETTLRIQTLDRDIKKLQKELGTEQEKNGCYEAQIEDMQSQLNELESYRDAVAAVNAKRDSTNVTRDLDGSEPAKVKELTLQIIDLEDTRNMQATLIEELENKISTVEAEALEFKSKAELEYEALSDGFKTLKNRRSEEIKVLMGQLEQHKLQEQIITKLQSDVDQLQAALDAVANSHSTENARISQVNAELNEALALKDQEVVQVRQNMTEFEGSHVRLVNSLQATLATINEEADAARKSRDEAVKALESLREELEALRHSLPINSKHMSLSQWSAEQQHSQQEQLKAIRELEEKLDGQVEEVKGEQQRAGILEANTKRKSQQLSLDMRRYLQLSTAIVHKTLPPTTAESEMETSDDDDLKASSPFSKTVAEEEKNVGTVSVRTMLKFLSHLQGQQPTTLSHMREGTEVTLAGDHDTDYESQLRVYLLSLNDSSLMEPWVKEKNLEGEIKQLEQRIQSLITDLDVANQKSAEGHSCDEVLRQQLTLVSKEKELVQKETSLHKKEMSLQAREEELVREEDDLQKKMDALPITPPITPFGSPSTSSNLVPHLMAGHQLARDAEKGDEKKQQQVEIVTQQAKLIKTLEDKIVELEKRGPLPPPLHTLIGDETAVSSSPMPGTPRSSAALTRIGSQTIRLNGPPDTPPPTIALPPIPTDGSSGDSIVSPRSTSPGSDEALSPRKKSNSLLHSISSDSLTSRAAIVAATEAAVAAAVTKAQEAQKELSAKLEKSEAELTKTLSRNEELEGELATTVRSSKQGQSTTESEMQKLRQENAELAQVLEDIRKSLDQTQTQVRGLEGLKTQLEAQVQKERQTKDEAVRLQDHLQAQLEAEKQKKKGFMCF